MLSAQTSVCDKLLPILQCKVRGIVALLGKAREAVEDAKSTVTAAALIGVAALVVAVIALIVAVSK